MIRPINYEKYNLFKQLNIKIDSSVELMLNDLIFKYSFRFKLIEVGNYFRSLSFTKY